MLISSADCRWIDIIRIVERKFGHSNIYGAESIRTSCGCADHEVNPDKKYLEFKVLHESQSKAPQVAAQ